MPSLASRIALALAALGLFALVPAAPADAQTWPAPTLQAGPARSAGVPLADLKGGGAFGVGPAFGTVNGVSIKIWPARAHGIVLNIGGAARVDTLSADVGYRFHFKPVGDDVTFQVTLGAEFRYRLASLGAGAVYHELGAGIPIGVSVLKRGLPAELFAEAVPLLVFYQVLGFDVAGVGGARFYF